MFLANPATKQHKCRRQRSVRFVYCRSFRILVCCHNRMKLNQKVTIHFWICFLFWCDSVYECMCKVKTCLNPNPLISLSHVLHSSLVMCPNKINTIYQWNNHKTSFDKWHWNCLPFSFWLLVCPFRFQLICLNVLIIFYVNLSSHYNSINEMELEWNVFNAKQKNSFLVSLSVSNLLLSSTVFFYILLFVVRIR